MKKLDFNFMFKDPHKEWGGLHSAIEDWDKAEVTLISYSEEARGGNPPFGGPDSYGHDVRRGREVIKGKDVLSLIKERTTKDQYHHRGGHGYATVYPPVGYEVKYGKTFFKRTPYLELTIIYKKQYTGIKSLAPSSTILTIFKYTGKDKVKDLKRACNFL